MCVRSISSSKRGIFQAVGFVGFGGEKGGRKEGGKFVRAKCSAISLILHPHSCRMQIIVANVLLLSLHHIIEVYSPCYELCIRARVQNAGSLNAS